MTFPPFNAIVPPEIGVDGEETAMRRAERGPLGARALRQAAAVPLPSCPGRPGRTPHVTADASGGSSHGGRKQGGTVEYDFVSHP